MFVCRDCATDEDRKGWRDDERTASGKECARCERRLPYLAKVRLLPDGWSSLEAPTHLASNTKVIRVEREESVLVDGHALAYVSIEGGPEVGLTVKPSGAVEVWVHDDPYGDGIEPSARWKHDAPPPLPEGECPEALNQEGPTQ